MTNDNKVLVEHSRSDEQRQVLEQIIADGVCPFCLENLKKYHGNPVTIISDHWIVTENQWPYDNALIQLLIIPKRHVENWTDLTEEELLDWAKIVKDALKEYRIESGAVCTRFGNLKQSGASVAHLHSQIIVQHPFASEPIRYKIGTKR